MIVVSVLHRTADAWLDHTAMESVPSMNRVLNRPLVAGMGAVLRCLAAALLWSGFTLLTQAAQSIAQEGSFRDCDECPEMVVVPAGSFVMGSPRGERDRATHEGPQRTIRIDVPLAVGRYEITRAQFAAFSRTVAMQSQGGGCSVFDAAKADFRRDESVRDSHRPGYPQGDDHPAVCVSWTEAKAYADWLSQKTGQRYRLLSEAEWEYAARAGTATSRPWGDDPALSCRHANLADETFVREVSRGPGRSWYPGWHACRDGFAFTAPVGRYQANRFGLHDMIGNVFEWVEDCWNESHAGASAGAGPQLSGDCALRVYRGGAWRSYPGFARSAHRANSAIELRHALIGFRVARSVENPRR